MQVTRAFVHHRRHEVGDAFLSQGILGVAAFKSEAKRHQRHRVFFNQPGFDAAGALDRLDVHSCCRTDEENGEKQCKHCKRNGDFELGPAAHEAASAMRCCHRLPHDAVGRGGCRRRAALRDT